MDNLGYLVAAYLIIWVGLFAYLFWMSGVTKALRGEIAELRLRLQQRSEAPPTGEQAASAVEAAGR